MSLDNWVICDPNVPSDVEDMQDYEYRESRHTGKENYSPGDSTANRVFYINYKYRGQFLDDLLGWAYLDGNFKVRRILPDQHPVLENFFANEAVVEPVGPPDIDNRGNPVFTLAMVTANYKPLPYEAALSDSEITSELDRFCVRKLTFRTDYIAVQGVFQWVTRTRNKGLTSAPGFPSPYIEKTITWEKVPSLPDDPYNPPNWKNIVAAAGTVNELEFDGHAPGTALLIDTETEFITPRFGGDNIYYRITYKWLIRDNGPWVDGDVSVTIGNNFLYDFQYERWDLVTAGASAGTASGQTIYNQYDHNQLFVIPGP